MSPGRWLVSAVFSVMMAVPVHASSFIITPTFDSSITSDPNNVAIEGAINSAIGVYENLFSNPVNVPIYFTEMSGGLGQSSSAIFDQVSYFSFYAAYSLNAVDNNDPAAQTALASGVVPNTFDNPVNGAADITLTAADMNALSMCYQCTGNNGYDGVISLNTHSTTPGSPGSSLAYYLVPVVEHEIDEVLGLGSALTQSWQNSAPQVEDLFRYASNGSRSYTPDTSQSAYFSISGTTDLAQFDNQGDGGDWGDWRNGSPPQVQNAFATPGANPSLGVEVTALEAVGYDLASPEPGTMGMFGFGVTILGLVEYRRRHGRRTETDGASLY